MKNTAKIFLLAFASVLLICSTCFSQKQLWGMTSQGGQFGQGVIFNSDFAGGSYSDYDLTALLGSNPKGSLVNASDGMIYGMTNTGGLNGLGVIFQYNPSTSTYTDKFDFDGSVNGANPTGSLIQASDGLLYGMTSAGGVSGLGVLFKYDPAASVFAKLLDFAGTTNGSTPTGSLIQAIDGKLYGMTSQGGVSVNNAGVLFQFDPVSLTYTKLFDFDFTGTGSTGGNPYGSLMQASDGKLYGMAQGGPSSSEGVLFQYDPISTFYSVLYAFPGGASGSYPYGSLVQAPDAKLYGMTFQGGANNMGVLFQFDPVGLNYVKKFDFTGTLNDGPVGSLMIASDGNLYGMTQAGGANAMGNVFQFNPGTPVYTNLHDFAGTDGNLPFYSNLIEVDLAITTSAVNTTTCQGSTINVPFLISGAYVSGNVFSAQLSDATGSFASPVTIAAFASTSEVGLLATIPANTPPGNGYRIRVVSSTPSITGTDNGSDITVNAYTNPAASITPGGPTTFCKGGGVMLTSSAGSSYLWSTGATSASIQDSISNSVTVVVTDASGCVSPASAAAVVTVNLLPLAPIITPGGPTTFCQGGNVTLNSSTGNSYSWSTGVSTASISVAVSGRDSLTVTDANGCTSASSEAVVVTVNPIPTIACIANQAANSPSGLCAATVNYGGPTVTGSPSPAVTYSFSGVNTSSGSGTGSGSVFDLGATTVTLTATNTCGTPSCSFTVTVTDAVNPTITAPSNLNVNTNSGCTATGVSLGAPTTADNCSVASVVNDHASTTYPLGNTTVTWTVTDGSGNTATATQTVTVTDNVDPTITAPSTVNVNTNAGCTATGVALGTPVTGDNCSVASVTNNSPSAFPLGNTTVIWTVTDGSGNSTTATQTVTVTDNANPTITSPSNVNVTTNSGCTSTGVNLGTPVTADNCSVASVANDAPSAFPLGNTTVTWTVTDGSGNTATATQTVKVTDNINPTITAPAIVNATTNTGCTATGVVLGTPVTADNCSVAVVFNNAPSAFPLGNTTVTWTVIDGSGNSATADQMVTVTDNIKPTITAPANVNVNITTGCTVIGVTLGFPVTADNCAVASLTNNAPSAFPLGNTTVTWTATDGSGNSATATQMVTVSDRINPSITAPSDVSICIGETVVLGTPVTADNCSIASVSNDHPSGAYPEGTTVVTWTVTDGSGNTATATQNVTVNPLPTATITPGGPTAFCNGGKVVLTCTAGSSYLWSTGATTQAVTISVNGHDSVMVTDGNGCTSASSPAIAVTIIPSDNSSFSYSSPTICKSGSDPSPFITGLAGGLFTSSPSGLSLDASSGKITLSSSALATYTVTYLTDGTCPASSTVSVTITTSPDAVFSYSNAYCTGEANPFPHFAAGASAGVFSALPAGLVFVNTATGEIDLAASTPDSYTVSNNIAAGGGCSSSAANFDVTISQVIAANAGSNAAICSGGSYTLAGIVGSSATGFSWTSSGTGVFDNAALLNATYTPSPADIANGSVVLTLTATNAVSAIAPCNEGISSMTLTINICTGIASASADYTVSVYPNPSSGNFVVTSSSAEQQLLQVFDVRGKLMFSQFLYSGSTTLDGNNLADGIYTLSVTGSKGRINKRLVVVK